MQDTVVDRFSNAIMCQIRLGTALDLISLFRKRHHITKINQYIVLNKKLLFRHFEESNFESVFNLGIQNKTNFKRYYA